MGKYMIPSKPLRDIRVFAVLCCLMVMLAACSVPSPSGTGVGQTPEPTKSNTNIVYTYQSFSSYQYQGQSYQDVTSYLKLYDVTTGAKNLIATIPHSRIDSYSATISPDGQWIMFETYTD